MWWNAPRRRSTGFGGGETMAEAETADVGVGFTAAGTPGAGGLVSAAASFDDGFGIASVSRSIAFIFSGLTGCGTSVGGSSDFRAPGAGLGAPPSFGVLRTDQPASERATSVPVVRA